MHVCEKVRNGMTKKRGEKRVCVCVCVCVSERERERERERKKVILKLSRHIFLVWHYETTVTNTSSHNTSFCESVI